MKLISRPAYPLLAGICIGISLSIVCLPYFYFDESCEFILVPSEPQLPQMRNIKQKAWPYGNPDDFEPRINLQGKPVRGKVEKGKVIRPRFAATELGIREKLFLGVIARRDTLNTLGVAINRTAAQYVSKLLFFVEAQIEQAPNGLPVVSFKDERNVLQPFHTMKYVADQYLNEYDWFMFIEDNTYVRAEQVFEFISHVSISQDIYLGRLVDELQSLYCDLRSGVILSNTALRKMAPQLDWCTKNAFSMDHTDNVGRCVLHTTGLACTPSASGRNFTSFLDSEFNFERDLSKLKDNKFFNTSLTVHPVNDVRTMYKLHRYFSEHEIELAEEEIAAIEQEMKVTACLTPQGCAHLPWPISAPEPFQPKSRFDVIRWDYFTPTHIYFPNDHDNMVPLRGADKLDIDDIIEFTMKKLREKYLNRYVFQGLVNGYRRFDPSRGLDYLLDVALDDLQKGTRVHKRIRLVKPLSHMEVVPMPYVTENSRVHIVLPVNDFEIEVMPKFLQVYAETCLEKNDNSQLYVVFVYSSAAAPEAPGQEESADEFSALRATIADYEKRYPEGARISTLDLRKAVPSQLDVVELVAKRMQEQDALVFVASAGILLETEFLNRVRMQTIRRTQVFLPIAFFQYHPKIIYEKKPYPEAIEINKDVGFFDRHSFDHVAFYLSDYVLARDSYSADLASGQRLQSTASANVTDLCSLFLRSDLHLFRAPDPALKHAWLPRRCNPLLPEAEYHRCLVRRGEGLASRSQLAMLILKQQRVAKDAISSAAASSPPPALPVANINV